MKIFGKLFGRHSPRRVKTSDDHNSRTGAGSDYGPSAAHLSHLLIYCFSLDELRDLCFELAVDYERLAGTSKDEKITSMIVTLKNQDRLEELIHAGTRLRPKAPWNIPTATPYEPYAGETLIELRRMLVQHFSGSELFDLSASVGVDWLLPPMPAGSVARELLEYFVRRERVDELLAACAQRKPGVPWTSVFEANEGERPVEEASTQRVDVDASHLVRGQIDLDILRQMLVTFFNEGELRALCRDLDVDYDHLPGGQNKAGEIVSYFDRRRRIPELVEACSRRRPSAP
jgi:hypothetical protein